MSEPSLIRHFARSALDGAGVVLGCFGLLVLLGCVLGLAAFMALAFL